MNRKTLIVAALVLGTAAAIPAMARGFGDGSCGGFGPGAAAAQGAGPGQGMGPGMGMGQGRMWKAHGGMMGGGMMGAGAMGARMCGPDAEARMAGMLAYAERKLNITPAQAADWKAFTETVIASKKPVTEACATLTATDPNTPTTLPQRLERMEAMLTARTQHMSALVPAVKTLYDKLTPEQKATADTLFPFGGRRG